MDVFLISKKREINAMGSYDLSTKQLIVRKGSVVSKTISESKTFRGARSVKKQRERYVVDTVVVEDVQFSSSSTAANFVTGSSTDGTRAWKNIDGKSIASIVKEMEEC